MRDLVVEVEDLDLAEASVAHARSDGQVGTVAVDMDSREVVIASHHDRIADRLDVPAQRLDVDIAMVRDQHVLRLVAVLVSCRLVVMAGMLDARRRGGRGRGIIEARRRDRRVHPSNLEHALEHAVEALPARIDHTCIFEHRQQ